MKLSGSRIDEIDPDSGGERQIFSFETQNFVTKDSKRERVLYVSRQFLPESGIRAITTRRYLLTDVCDGVRSRESPYPSSRLRLGGGGLAVEGSSGQSCFG